MPETTALCYALNPDSARTGYPGALQWFDKQSKTWKWLYVGMLDCSDARQVQDVADRERKLRLGTRVRFVFVKRWVRVPFHTKGWHAVLDSSKTIEVVKERNVKPKCSTEVHSS